MKKPSGECSKSDLLAVRDSLDALSGRWKLPVLIVLLGGTKRFRQIAKEIDGISDRMLSKELKALEENSLITRRATDDFPEGVEYAVTAHTESLHEVISALREWGYLHRKKIVGK